MDARLHKNPSDSIEQQIRQLPCSKSMRERALVQYRTARDVVGWVADVLRGIRVAVDAALSHLTLNASRRLPGRKL
jgi:hypothetical protein